MADAFLELYTPGHLDDGKAWVISFLKDLIVQSEGNGLRIEFIEERYFTESGLPESGSSLTFWISGNEAFAKTGQRVLKSSYSAPSQVRIALWEEDLSRLEGLSSSTSLTERIYRSPNSVPYGYMTHDRPDSTELIDLTTQTSVRVERIGSLALSRALALRFQSTKLAGDCKHFVATRI